MAALQLVPRISLNKILFTTDFSDYAERALPYAVGLARHYGGTVFVAHAIPPEPRRPLPLEPVPPELDELRYEARHAMDTFVRSAPLAGVRYEVVLEKGEIEPVFQDMIKNHAIDLVVIATHGRGGLKKLLLGSVAEEIFRTVDNGTDDLMNLAILGSGGRGPSLRKGLCERGSSLCPQGSEGRSDEGRSSRLAQGTGDAAVELSVRGSFARLNSAMYC